MGAFMKSNAQVLKGFVHDKNGNGLLDANVILYKPNTNQIVKYAQSDEKGYYSLSLAGDMSALTVVVSILGFEKETVTIDILGKDGVIVRDFTLREAVLQELVVKASAIPIVAGEDTTTYRADSFRDGSEKNVEDLLKKLPGISVKEDGTIYAKGKKVEKVMLDGEDLLGKDYKVLTKNVSADLIDKVQSIDNFSDSPLLKGIENSEKMVLNLTIKANRKRFAFGNVNLAAGTEGRYEEGLNLFSYTKKVKSYLIGGLDNIGNQPLGGDYATIGYAYQALGVGEIANTDRNLINKENPNFSTQLNKNRVNLNKSVLGNFNLLYSPNTRLKIKTNSIFYTDKLTAQSSRTQTFFIESDPFKITQEKEFTARPVIGYLNTNLKYNVDTASILTMNFNVSKGEVRTNCDVFSNANNLNVNSIRETLRDNNRSLLAQVNYTRRLSPTKAFLVEGFYKTTISPQGYRVDFLNPVHFVKTDSTNLFLQNTDQTKHNFSLLAKLLGRMNKDKYFVEIGTLNNWVQLKSAFYPFEHTASSENPDLDYSNDAVFQTSRHFVKGEYIKRMKDVNVIVSLRLNWLQSVYNTVPNADKFYTEPQIGFNWAISKIDKLSAITSSSQQFATITDIYKGNVLTDYRTFSTGRAAQNLIKSRTAMMIYSHTDAYNQWFLNCNLMYITNNAFYANSTFLSNDFTIMRREILEGASTFSSNLHTDKFIPFLSSRFDLDFDKSISKRPNLINGISQQSAWKTRNLRLSYNTAFKGVFNMGINYAWQNAHTKFSNAPSDFRNKVRKMGGFIIIKPSGKLHIRLNGDAVQSEQLGKQFFFLDLNAAYTVKKDKIYLELQGNNLLNIKNYEQYNIDNVSKEQFTQRIIPSYLLLRMKYNF
jgi:hypothetical protein